MRPSRLIPSAVLLLVVIATVLSRTCGEDRREAIAVTEDRVVITNLTDGPWTGVEVWLNDWYRAQAPRLESGQRLEIPLRAFVAGYDRRFEPARQAPLGIEVSGKSAGGTPVLLTWGRGRQR